MLQTKHFVPFVCRIVKKNVLVPKLCNGGNVESKVSLALFWQHFNIYQSNMNDECVSKSFRHWKYVGIAMVSWDFYTKSVLNSKLF